MIIDFHTHIFPEKIAARTLDTLSATICLEPAMNGTDAGLLDSMERSGVDISVVQPVVTKPSQFDSILRFASHINEAYADRTDGRLISFAGIHPDDPDYSEHLALIRREGFTGVKLHPNYQGVFFSDIRYKRVIYAAQEQGLAVLTHAGYDPYTPDQEYCSPDMILDVLRDVAPEKLILAHLGNNEHYEETEEKLYGLNVYIDTAYSILRISAEQFRRIVQKHGADKILFGTDCPWADQKECIEKIESCGLDPESREMIFSGNARRILGL